MLSGEKLIHIRKGLGSAGRNLVIFLSGIIAFILWVYSMRSSFCHWHEETQSYTELLLPRIKDNLAWNILCLLGCIALLTVIYLWCRKRHFSSSCLDVAAWIISGILLVGSICWVLWIRIVPGWDPAMLIQFVRNAREGNWSCFGVGGYMSNYFHQTGLFSVLYFLEGLGTDGWRLYQLFNCIAWASLPLAGIRIIRRLGGSDFAGGIYLAMMLFCLPGLFYTAFVYGELVSVFFCMCGIMLVCGWTENKSFTRYFLCLTAVMTCALWIRKNALIVWVAILLCCILEWIHTRCNRKILLGVAAAMLLSFLLYQAAGKLVFYEYTKECRPIPAITWVVMGMEKSSMGYGYFNAFATLTFEECGYDTEKTKERSLQRIGEILNYYIENPKEGLEFYKEKILWQWTDPSFESTFATQEFEGKGLPEKIYYGSLRVPVWKWMECCQNLVYFGLIAGLIWLHRRKETGRKLLIPVMFLGYFFFSILWEAKPRYMVMCYFMLIPLSSIGISWVCCQPFSKGLWLEISALHLFGKGKCTNKRVDTT